MPIHESLIRLSILRLIDDCRARGQAWLFPDVERCAAKNRLSGTFSKAFTHYRIAEGVCDPRRDFRALRTDFDTKLKRADCPLEIRKRLMGHELRYVTAVNYDLEGSPVAEFKRWIDRIKIDVSGVRCAWRDAAAPIGARH